MVTSKKTLRTCPNGHKFYKSSDCPVCPVCEKERYAKESFIPGISAPARRALEGAGIRTLAQLSKFSAPQLLKMHGIGPSAIPKFLSTLKAKGLSLNKK
jgi:predicted RecB family nuclease